MPFLISFGQVGMHVATKIDCTARYNFCPVQFKLPQLCCFMYLYGHWNLLQYTVDLLQCPTSVTPFSIFHNLYKYYYKQAKLYSIFNVDGGPRNIRAVLHRSDQWGVKQAFFQTFPTLAVAVSTRHSLQAHSLHSGISLCISAML